jgi:hypothetical protein
MIYEPVALFDVVNGGWGFDGAKEIELPARMRNWRGVG